MSKAKNEAYTSKAMLQELGKVEFLKAMKSELPSLFDEKMWELVPQDEMVLHYTNQHKTDKTIDIQQIMMI